MDLIAQRIASAKRYDIAVCYPLTVDFEVGEKNDFGVELSLDEYKQLGTVNYMYFEGTEWGGVVDKVTVNTETERVELYGRCWTGLLNSRIIKPDSGQDYYIVTGTVKSILESLMSRLVLGSYFEVGECSSTSLTWQFDRYCGAYDGITKMLASVGLKLKLTDRGDKVVLQAVPVVDYSDQEEWSSSQMAFTMSKSETNRFIYLICLGAGELKDRKVINLRLNLADGSILRLAGYALDPYSYEEVFNYPNVEDENTLVEEGTKRLKEMYEKINSIKTVFIDYMIEYDIGDLIGARDEYLGLTVKEPITQKIFYIAEDGRMSIDCNIGGIE